MIVLQNSWPDGPHSDAIKFVAQSMYELLNDRANPSFRLKSIDLMASIIEMVQVCQNVEQAAVDIRNIESVTKETIRRIKEDPCARNLFPYEFEALDVSIRQTLKKEISPDELANRATKFVRILNREYHIALEKYILENYQNRQNWPDLRMAISSYLSHLVICGYSKSFLQRTVRLRFLTDDISKCEKRTLSRFLKSFKNTDRTFQVWAISSKSSANFFKKAKFEDFSVIPFSRLAVDVRKAFEAVRDVASDTEFITSRVAARDSYAADAKFRTKLGSVQSLTAMSEVNINIYTRPGSYVRPVRSSDGEIVDHTIDAVRNFVGDVGGFHSDRIRERARIIYDEFSAASRERILASLSMAHMAKSSPRVENKLISVWSAFEVLIKTPPKGSVRIKHYRQAISPIIASGYARKQVNGIGNYYNRFNKTLLKDILSQVDIDNASLHLKLANVLVNEKYSDLQNSLFNGAKESPLLQFRIWQFRESFSSKSNFLASVNRHFDNVDWQIERIYRVRNQLVHAGMSPDYLQSLYQNAAEYFRSIMVSLVSRAKRYPEQTDVDELISEFAIDFSAMLHRLQDHGSTSEFTPGDMRRFFGS